MEESQVAILKHQVQSLGLRRRSLSFDVMFPCASVVCDGNAKDEIAADRYNVCLSSAVVILVVRKVE
jgi:hypothetical protein